MTSTAPRRRTRAEAKAQTRRRVLDAARETFVREGFHAATLDQIAARAGYTKGAVYSGFGGKADLFLAVFEERVERRVAEYRALDEPSAEGPIERAVAAWGRVLREERDWTTVLIEFRAFVARDPDLRARFAELHGRVREAAAASVARAFPGGAGALAPDEIALANMALGNGFALEAIGEPGSAVAETYETVARALMLALSRGDDQEA